MRATELRVPPPFALAQAVMLHTGEGPQQEAQLSLFFEAFETAALLVTVVLVTFVLCVANGCSNWLVGVVLTSAYLVVCQGFWSHKDEDLDAVSAERRRLAPGLWSWAIDDASGSHDD